MKTEWIKLVPGDDDDDTGNIGEPPPSPEPK